MTDLRNQRRLASQVLGCGETRVWIDPLHAEDVAAAVTRGDIRNLVAKGYIEKLQAKGISRGRARALALQKSKGKRKGPGSREGSRGSYARDPPKARWMRTIRPLRQTLALVRDEGLIDPATYRTYYRRAKGGVFRSRPHMLSHMVTDGLLNEAKAQDVRVRAEAARAASFGKPAPGTERPAPARKAPKPRASKEERTAKKERKAQRKKPKDEHEGHDHEGGS
jgi:large subunit ribosomal protein L19e